MDPLTQGLLGAAAAQVCFSRQLGRSACVVGLIGGMTADLDVFYPAKDSLEALVIHRHASHSLLLIPLFALLTFLPLMLLKRFREKWKYVAGAVLVSYSTHGLLDASTAYGTVLLWPASNMRVAWDLIAIIDPVFTFTLSGGVVVSTWRVSYKPAGVALVVCGLYFGLSSIQHERVAGIQAALAERRGHTIERRRVVPTLGNILVWRSVYEYDGRYYADGVRAGLGKIEVKEGESIAKFDASRLDCGTPACALLLKRYREYEWFADGYTVVTEEKPLVIGDVRYGVAPESVQPIWGLTVDEEDAERKVDFRHFREKRGPGLSNLFEALMGRDEGYVEFESQK